MHVYLRKETKTTMSYYSVQDGLLFKSYLPGRLRTISIFRDQLVVPETLVDLILNAYHGPGLSGGHLATHSDRLTTKSAKTFVANDKSRRARLTRAMPNLPRTKNSTQQTEAPDRPLTFRAAFKENYRLSYSAIGIDFSRWDQIKTGYLDD